MCQDIILLLGGGEAHFCNKLRETSLRQMEIKITLFLLSKPVRKWCFRFMTKKKKQQNSVMPKLGLKQAALDSLRPPLSVRGLFVHSSESAE